MKEIHLTFKFVRQFVILFLFSIPVMAQSNIAAPAPSSQAALLQL
jgi:hypothetical protein